MALNICTFNCKGFNLSKVKHIESLLITSDILLLQETFFQMFNGKNSDMFVVIVGQFVLLKGTDQAGTFMSLKCVVYYANYRSWHQSSKIQVVS